MFCGAVGGPIAVMLLTPFSIFWYVEGLVCGPRESAFVSTSRRRSCSLRRDYIILSEPCQSLIRLDSAQRTYKNLQRTTSTSLIANTEISVGFRSAVITTSGVVVSKSGQETITKTFLNQRATRSKLQYSSWS